MRRIKTVALIGNGKINGLHWFDISRCDLVIRFNACKHFGQITGRRSDVVVFVNTGRSGQKLALESGTVDRAAIAAAKEFWFAAPADVRAHELARNPTTEDAPTHKDHPGDWEDFSDHFRSGICAGRISSFIESDHYFAAQTLLKEHGAKDGTRPSTGFLTLCKVRQTWKPERISLYGFQHTGWPGHPWDAERSAIDAMSEVKRRERGSKINFYFTEAGRRGRAALGRAQALVKGKASIVAQSEK